MPSTSTVPASGSTSSTRVSSPAGRPRRGTGRSRNRFDSGLSSARTPPAVLQAWARASAKARARVSWSVIRCCLGFLPFCRFFNSTRRLQRRVSGLVQVIPRHRVGVGADIAFAEDDLEQIGLALGGAEHLRAADQVGAPDAAEAFVEALRIHRLDRVPVGVEPLRPVIQRQRVVAAQILDIENLEPLGFHGLERLRETGNPAAGKMYLRMKKSVSRSPTWPMKCMRPMPPGFSARAWARITSLSWWRPACSSTPMETTLS